MSSPTGIGPPPKAACSCCSAGVLLSCTNPMKFPNACVHGAMLWNPPLPRYIKIGNERSWL